MSSGSGRSIFVGHFAPDPHIHEDLKRTFERYGEVERIDVKKNFAFVFMDTHDHAVDAVKALFGKEISGQRVRIEICRGDGAVKRREEMRNRSANTTPNETLFVVNFDSERMTEEQLQRLFEKYGRVTRVDLKRPDKTFGFVQFERLEDAKAAKEGMDGKVVDDREITVQYVTRQPFWERDRGDRYFERKRSRSRSRSPPDRRYRRASPPVRDRSRSPRRSPPRRSPSRRSSPRRSPVRRSPPRRSSPRRSPVRESSRRSSPRRSPPRRDSRSPAPRRESSRPSRELSPRGDQRKGSPARNESRSAPRKEEAPASPRRSPRSQSPSPRKASPPRDQAPASPRATEAPPTPRSEPASPARD
ncbi:putative RNA recognition motif domain [Paratrimastix pyriformis]|uniref:RNA recognition motif domain n=1 Tax=Paratrimastix pyriformis TaxID=342808 RepID=A0ABQ8UXD5_9EUKA|nr:putative RNA recognition motif domain [Paratrimastix pyriformis]